MPINVGGTTLSDIRIGGTAVTKVYCGSEEIWPVLAGFSSSASYTGGQVSFATTSVATSTISTAGSTAAWTVDSVDTFANNAATDGQSSLSFDQLTATVVYDGTVDPPYTPPTNQVVAGNNYTATGTEDGTSTARRRYTNTITQAAVDTSATTRTPNARGVVPPGYSNSDENIVIQVSVPIAGDTAQAPPARAIPASYGGGTLAAGSSVERNGPVTPVSRSASIAQTGSGTYTLTISGEQAPTSGDTDTYTVAAGGDNGGLADTNYAWTVSGGTINSGQGTASISVTWGAGGSGSVGVSNSFAAAAGPNFSASDSHAVTVASASNCRTRTASITGYPTGTAPVYGPSFASISFVVGTVGDVSCGNINSSQAFAFAFFGTQGDVAPASAFSFPQSGTAVCVNVDSPQYSETLTVSDSNGNTVASSGGTTVTDGGACTP